MSKIIKEFPDGLSYWFDLVSKEDLPELICDSIQDLDVSDFLVNNICLYHEKGCFTDQPDWEKAKEIGVILQRNQYLSLIRSVSLAIALKKLKENENLKEIELIHLIRILDEIDRSVSKISERIEEYIRAVSSYGIRDSLNSITSLIQLISKDPDHPLMLLCREVIRLKESRTLLLKDVIKLSDQLMPNMSAICGPVVSARLLSAAGGRDKLACMAGSSLQVLGAGPSLFSHLLSSTPPPKHGIIFEYKGVHQANKKVRGRVSRVLACQLVIAARIDLYRGTLDSDFLKKAYERICRAKNSR